MWCQAAMDFVVEEDLKAHLTCWYIQKYVKENPQPQYFEHIYQWHPPCGDVKETLERETQSESRWSRAKKKGTFELNIGSFTSINMKGQCAGSEGNGIKEPKCGAWQVRGRFSSLARRRCSMWVDPLAVVVVPLALLWHWLFLL